MNQPTPFFGNIDLRDNQLVKAVFENRETHPNPKDGKIYYNTVHKCAYCYVGGDTWVDITKFYEHPIYQAMNPELSGAHILASLVISEEGHIVEAETRILTLTDLGFVGDVDATNYTHPTFNIQGTGVLEGAQIISNLSVNDEGHVTGLATRELRASDIGGAVINDSLTSSIETWSSQRIQDTIDAKTTDVDGTMVYKGRYDVDTNSPNIFTHRTKEGHFYDVQGSGDFMGTEVKTGDLIIALMDSPTYGTDWSVISVEIPTIEDATHEIYGLIRLATDQEVINGDEVNASVQPHQLNIWFENSEMNRYDDPFDAYKTARDTEPRI